MEEFDELFFTPLGPWRVRGSGRGGRAPCTGARAKRLSEPAGAPDRGICRRRRQRHFCAPGWRQAFGNPRSTRRGRKPHWRGRPALGGVCLQPARRRLHTLLVGAIGAMSIAAAIYSDLKYHPTKTLTPLAMIGNFPLIMAVSSDNPSRNVKELVEWGKQHPDKANYPSTSPLFTIAMEQLKLKSGMPGVMIPYKSSNEMILSLIEGQTMAAIADPPPTVPQVKAGKVKALAVTGSERLAELPDVPSMAEAGYPNVDMQGWSGIFAPAATPPAITAKLEKALSQSIRDPEVSAKLKNLAVAPGGGPPDDFRRIVEDEIVKVRDVVKAANLKFEE